MTAGRPPKPTNKLKLHGTFQPCRRNKTEPTPEVVIPERPKFLKKEAKKEWNRIAPLLEQQRCLTEIDRALLSAYCMEWQIYVELCRKIKQHTIYTISGNLVQDPQIAIKNKALENLRKLAAEFGMSPSSRTRIAVTPAAKEENPFAKLINQKKNVG